MPNSVDGRGLVNMWPRIISEEIEMSELFTSIGLPTLQFTRCKVGVPGGHNYFDTYSSPSFASYKKDGNYIIDTKNIKSTIWPHDSSLSLFRPLKANLVDEETTEIPQNAEESDLQILDSLLHDLDLTGEHDSSCRPLEANSINSDSTEMPQSVEEPDLNLWVQVLDSLLRDLDLVGEHGLCLSYDTLNLVFVAKGSRWHSGGQLPFEIRLFGFDFASKTHVLDLSNLTPLSYGRVYRMLSHLVEYAIWEEYEPKSFSLSKKSQELHKKLVDLCKVKLKTYDPTRNQEEEERRNECIIC
jgi:hypothetical protein